VVVVATVPSTSTNDLGESYGRITQTSLSQSSVIRTVFLVCVDWSTTMALLRGDEIKMYNSVVECRSLVTNK
jgi:hypothetical protein